MLKEKTKEGLKKETIEETIEEIKEETKRGPSKQEEKEKNSLNEGNTQVLRTTWRICACTAALGGRFT